MGLDSVELVMMCEEIFCVELPDEEVRQTVTPRKLGDLIYSTLKDGHSASWTRKDISDQIRQIVTKKFNVPENIYNEDGHFINDLGIDSGR